MPHDAAPIVSFIDSANAVHTVGWSVTVSGVSFGARDATPSSRLGLSSCATVSWASSTTTVCLPSGGHGPGLDSLMTVAGIVGTGPMVFTYDGAVNTRKVQLSAP